MQPVFTNGIVVGFLYTFAQFAAILLCIRHVLRDGWWSGMALGLGNAASQIIFVLLAVWLSHYPVAVEPLNKIFIVLTAIVLFIMAYHFRKHPDYTLSPFLLGVMVTIPFVVDITGYLGILQGAGLQLALQSSTEIGFLLIAVVLGNIIWWLIFTGIVAIFHKKTTEQRLRTLNKIIFIIMICLGVLTLGTLFL